MFGWERSSNSPTFCTHNGPSLSTSRMANRVGCANAFRNSAFSCNSEREELVTFHCPLGQGCHSRFLSTLEIGLLLVDAATGHAGSADLHFHAFGDEVTKHLTQILVIFDRLLVRIPCKIDRIVHEENANLVSGGFKLAGQAQRIPSHIRSVIGGMVENHQNATHQCVSLSCSSQSIWGFIPRYSNIRMLEYDKNLINPSG